MRFFTWTKVAAFALAGIGVDAEEAFARVEAGMLTCEVGKGFALILSKPRDLHCVFHKSNGQTEAYAGKLREVGLDIGVSGRGVIAWGVIAATSELPPGELAGTYAGVEAGAAAVKGGRGAVLVGGANKTVSLQPLSVEGEAGINIAVGIASISLHPLVTGRPHAGTRAPAVGHSYAAVPHAQQIPHYGCGSYTHLQRGQTLSGLAHACGVTLEALLDANPQITNVRDIDAGALVHLPTHVGHHVASSCGDRAILEDNESLDHLAWRCGVTLHALLLENPDVRDMAMVQPGLVMAIPERGVPATQPPVQYVMNETDILPSGGFVASDAASAYPVPRFPPPAATGADTRNQARLEIICVNEATNRYGFRSGDVFATGSVQSGGGTRSVRLDAHGDEGVCLIDDNGNVLFVTDLSGAARRGPAAAAVAGAVVGGAVAAIASNRSSSAPARSSTPAQAPRGGYVAEEDFFQVSLTSPGSYLNVHSAPSSSASAVGRFPDGATLRNVGGCQYPGGRQWCNVEASGGGVRGWVAGEFLTIPGPGGGSATARAPSRSTPSSSDVSNAARQACLSAVSRQTNERNVSILSSEFSEANSAVMVGVGANRAPWRCLVSNDGSVQEVSFTGDDSAGVPSPQASAPSNPAPSSSDVSSIAQQACLTTVASQTNERNVSVLSSEFSEANSLVMVGVGENQAPWRCLVSNDGAVQEVEFTGDDGGGAMAGSQPSSDVSDAAVQACRSAVSNETNEGDVAVLSTEFSEANSLVMIGVGAQRAPWRCLVANDGTVQEVSFTGSEGAL